MDEELRVACGKVSKKGSTNATLAPIFVARGANPGTQDDDGWNALMYACGCGLMEAARYLLDECIQSISVDTVDDDGCSALWIACYNNQRATAALLMSKGARLDLKGRDGHKPAVVPSMAGNINFCMLFS